jgi:hypothetical protein
MIRVSTPFQALIKSARQAKDQLTEGQRKLLEALGTRLVGFAKKSVEVRSTGASDAGIEWQPLDRSYQKHKGGGRIGVASGRLFESAEAYLTKYRFGVSFEADHARFFARRRPLLPETLPPEWEAALEEDVEAWGDEILKETLETNQQ